MTKDVLKIKGVVSIVLTDEFGNVKENVQNNMVMIAGLAHIISRLKEGTAGVISHIAVGTGTTAADNTQTALVTEIGRQSTTASIGTTTVTNDTLIHEVVLAAGTGTGALTEAGLFNASTEGTMVARTVFAVVNKLAADTLTLTWKLVIA